MHILFNALGIFCIAAYTSAAFNNFGDAYYWSDFTGTIPADAVPGGTDEKGLTTYIGKTDYFTEVIPGEIRHGRPVLYYELDGVRTGSTNIKILCTSHLGRLKWIPVNSNSIRFLWSAHIIEGGYYAGHSYPYLIGRASIQNGIRVVGKLPTGVPEIAVYYNAGGVWGKASGNIEVLSYEHEAHVVSNSSDCTTNFNFCFQ